MRTGSSTLLALLLVSNLYSSEAICEIKEKGIIAMEFSSNNTVAWTTLSNEVKVHDIYTGKLRWEKKFKGEGQIGGLCGNVVFLGTKKGLILLSLKTLKPLCEVEMAKQKIVASAISSRCERIAVVNDLGDAFIFSLRTGKLTNKVRLGRTEFSQTWSRFRFADDCKKLYFFLHSIASKDDTITRIVDVNNGRVVHSLNTWHDICGQSIKDVCLSRSDQRLFALTYSNGLFEYDVRTRQARRLFFPPQTARSVEHVKTGKLDLALVFCDSLVIAYDVENKKALGEIKLPSGIPRQFLVSPDNNLAAVLLRGVQADHIVIIDLKKFKQ